MFGWPVKAGCKVCFRTGPMWFWFIFFQFVCEQGLVGGGGLQGDYEPQKQSRPVVLTPPVMFTPLYSPISDHPRRKEKISLGIVGGGPYVCMCV